MTDSRFRGAGAAALALVCATVSAQTQEGSTPTSAPVVWGLEYTAPDPGAMVRFYQAVAGFTVQTPPAGETAGVVRNGELRLLIRKGAAAPAPEDAPRFRLNVRVPDLRAAAAAARGAGGAVPDPEPAAFVLGEAVPIRDPAGYPLTLVRLRDRPLPDQQPRIFNISLTVPDLVRCEDFARRLGFAVFSRDYLPKTLPLQPRGAAPLVLHSGAATTEVPGSPTLLLAVPDLDRAREFLAPRRIGLGKVPRPTPVGRALSARFPSGLRIAFVERSVAQRAFEHLCTLSGDWKCTSTKGWRSEVRLRRIARGSALVSTSAAMNRHPGESMLTVYHLDGTRLLLTHYCVAGNQPRLQATHVDPDLAEIRFTFLDGTNLTSRDTGHMDACTMKFAGPDRFTVAWTWFADGASRPMETIDYSRSR